MASKKQKYNVKQFEKTILVFEAIKFHKFFFAHFQHRKNDVYLLTYLSNF